MSRAALLLACAAFTACSSATAPVEKPMSLDASEWGTQIQGQYIQFRQGKVSGNGGCNRFSGTYTQDGARITFGPLMSTKMACENLNAEIEFFGQLDQARQIAVSHLELVLKDAEGLTLLTLKRRDWD